MEQRARYGTMAAPGYSGDPRRMAIMVEPMPWLRHRDCAEALMFRGAIIAGWGYVETTLNEIAIRCSKCDEYEGIRSRYPYHIPKKLAFLREVLKASGPLARFRSFGLRSLDQFEASQDIRNLMAHGRMRMLDARIIEIDQIIEEKGTLKHDPRPFDLREFERRAMEATKLSRRAYRALSAINREKLLPEML